MKNLLLTAACLLLFSIPGQAQTDTLPPVLVCKAGPIDLPTFFCYRVLNAAELIDTVYDNQGPSAPIQTGIRRVCTGTGFPIDTTLTFIEWAFVMVEVWARDTAGNTSTGMVEVIVYDALGNCDPVFSIQTQTPLGEPLKHCTIRSQSESPCYSYSTDWTFNTGNQGDVTNFGFLAPSPGYDLTVTPSKMGDPLNGVTTADLVRIAQHLLGLQPFTEPWQYIAADANQDGQVTTYDIVVLRRLLLGLTQELPNGKSWRFYPDNYQFPANSDTPLQPTFPEAFFEHIVYFIPTDIRFIGVKIGDVTGDASGG